MRNRPQLILIALLMCCSLYAFDADAATINAACTQAAITTAYNSASDGDTILVAAGTATFTSVSTIKKKVTIQGNGIGSSIIKLYYNGKAFDVMVSNVRITGFTMDCNGKNQANQGIINVGSHNGSGCLYGNATPQIADFRIDHNRFINCGRSVENMYPAIVTAGPVYGLIDHNTFETCNGECITLYQDGRNAWDRSNEPGQYAANKTIYIEDNTFNYDPGPWAENAVDTNEGARFCFRYNTINMNSTNGLAGVVSGHDACDLGDACYDEDYAGSPLVEVYGNKLYNNAAAFGDYFVHWRGGRLIAYNNTAYGASYGNYFAKAYYRRSEHRGCGFGIYSQYCHEVESGKISEGISANKTTLQTTLANGGSETTIAMGSVTGFPTYGGSIKIGSEQIDYTGISGNNLTGCMRGANTTSKAAHSIGTNVSLLNFGVCVYQNQNSYLWNNVYVGVSNNKVEVLDMISDGQAPYYNSYDIKSYAQRPQNWQYRNDGTPYDYTPYPYPHPLITGNPIPPSPPDNLRLLK